MSHIEGPSYSDSVRAALEHLESVPGSGEWPVSERLTAFFFMLLDGVEQVGLGHDTEEGSGSAESAADVSERFDQEATGFSSDFQKALREALSVVVSGIDLPGVNRLIADSEPSRFVVSEMLVQLIGASLADESEGRERSAALADRTLGFASSILTTPVPQKAVDLVRYSVEAGYLPIDRVPVVGEWLFGKKEDANEG